MNDSIYIFKYEGLWYACPAIQTIVNQVSLPAARADEDEELDLRLFSHRLFPVGNFSFSLCGLQRMRFFISSKPHAGFCH